MSLSAQNLSALDSSSLRCTPAGKPRLIQLERHLHRFYEPLILLSMLVRWGTYERESTSKLGEKGEYKPWHRFLDQLCWLCDYECGGKSVTSIAVQATTGELIYWVAVKQKSAAKALSHLKWILLELGKLDSLSPNQQQGVEDEIVRRSVEFSSARVKNYGRWLCNFIGNVMEQQSPGSPQEGQQNSARYLA
jgi:hypothetical protein